MPTFSNANDKTAITAISVKILFFLMKSIMHINNLFIKFLYKIINNYNHSKLRIKYIVIGRRTDFFNQKKIRRSFQL